MPVGAAVVPQTVPRSVIAAPPSMVTFAPSVAVVSAIDVAVGVVSVGAADAEATFKLIADMETTVEVAELTEPMVVSDPAVVLFLFAIEPLIATVVVCVTFCTNGAQLAAAVFVRAVVEPVRMLINRPTACSPLFTVKDVPNVGVVVPEDPLL